MKSVKKLIQNEGRVYVYLSSNEICKRFFADAEAEGMVFCDGTKPSQKQAANIIALNHDGTMNYVGTNGRIAFGLGAERIGNARLIRVDYERYLADDSYNPD